MQSRTIECCFTSYTLGYCFQDSIGIIQVFTQFVCFNMLYTMVISTFLFFKHFSPSHGIRADQSNEPISEDLETTSLLNSSSNESIAADQRNRNKKVIIIMTSYLIAVFVSVCTILLWRMSEDLKLYVAGTLGMISVLTGVFSV